VFGLKGQEYKIVQKYLRLCRFCAFYVHHFCAGIFLEGKASLATLAFLKLSIILGIGMVYDRKMILFLHKQNFKNGPEQAKLVPWKSGGQTYNFLVPVNALQLHLW